jgi:hypothetical protein
LLSKSYFYIIGAAFGFLKMDNLSIAENPPFDKGGQKPPQVHPRNILPIALGNNMNRDANTEF